MFDGEIDGLLVRQDVPHAIARQHKERVVSTQPLNPDLRLLAHNRVRRLALHAST